MTRLFTYTIRVDDGAAPNPFYGMCSLAICKPAIRRVAKPGDWIAGLGSKRAPSGDLSGHLVYAMKIEEVLSMKDYDTQASLRWPHRIPNIHSTALQERLGDCIYDFSGKEQPTQRLSVHGKENVTTDLNGKNVLISKDFYYFGSSARKLPNYLINICHQTQGHRSELNAPYLEKFISWIRSVAPVTGQIYGWPDYIIKWESTLKCGGCASIKSDNEPEST